MFDGYANCHQCDIRDIVLFAELNDRDFDLIAHPIPKYIYEAGSMIYPVGDAGQAIFTVRHGIVKLVYFGPDGSQRIVGLLRVGSVAGIEALASKPYEQTAIAMDEVHVCRIAVEDVNRLDLVSQRLHRQLLERWYISLREANNWIIYMSTGEAKVRLARLFLYLAGIENECELFSREDIGAVLGLTSETVSRTITDFKEAGLISQNKHNYYKCKCDIKALRSLAGYESRSIPDPNQHTS